MRGSWTAFAVAGCLLIAACSPGSTPADPKTTATGSAPSATASGAPSPGPTSDTPWTAVPTSPDGAAFYTAPAPPSGAKPGDVIWRKALTAPEDARGWAILYWSSNLDGSLIPVSAVVFEPRKSYRAPRPILAWAHGTFGMGDQCAPSQGFFKGNGASIPLVEAAVKEGLVFVATDYRGLGTPGPHPYLVNQTAARDVLDSITAAGKLTGQAAQPEGLVMGQSQGGGAALVSAEIAPSYTPNLKIRGVVGVSVPSNLNKLDSQLSGGPYFGYVLMTIDGYRSVYPALADDDSKLTAAGMTALQQIQGQCTTEILDAFAGKRIDEYGAAKVLDAADFATELTKNEPGHVKTPIPMFLVHGEDDDTIPVQNSQKLLTSYCSLGDTVMAKVYPGAGHVDVLGTALPDIVPYLRNRLAKTPAVSSCPS